ncbi:DUF2085 domain-containing protein [Halorarum salinum]|uniref:DUF2085 domain-containing protein n=1 Tax=Halorarum salinum TaxID=2743089 RepID=A0A7D5QE28_9EURY|nr:DUF2085 domain-containing protein [Halobaculum salinum]QLG62601.1 DUF2085 domain-containing protein [Halobaculum salinum]
MSRLTDLPAEVRAGLRAAAPYLLSHHPPAERPRRCHSVRVRGRRYRLCARCAGVHPGIAIGLLAAAGGVRAPLAAVAALPAPALLEWVLTGYGDRPGRNDVRTATGLALGLGYGFGLASLVTGRGRPGVVAVGLGYATLAAAFLYADSR